MRPAQLTCAYCKAPIEPPLFPSGPIACPSCGQLNTVAQPVVVYTTTPPAQPQPDNTLKWVIVGLLAIPLIGLTVWLAMGGWAVVVFILVVAAVGSVYNFFFE